MLETLSGNLGAAGLIDCHSIRRRGHLRPHGDERAVLSTKSNARARIELPCVMNMMNTIEHIILLDQSTTDLRFNGCAN